MKTALFFASICLFACADIKTDHIAGTTHTMLFATDGEGLEVTPNGAKFAKFNQSKVPLSAIRTAGTVGTAAIVNGMMENVAASNNGVTMNASNNALAATQAKEATKQAANAGKTAVDLAKVAKP